MRTHNIHLVGKLVKPYEFKLILQPFYLYLSLSLKIGPIYPSMNQATSSIIKFKVYKLVVF
jgi:hypothetical protein